MAAQDADTQSPPSSRRVVEFKIDAGVDAPGPASAPSSPLAAGGSSDGSAHSLAEGRPRVAAQRSIRQLASRHHLVKVQSECRLFVEEAGSMLHLRAPGARAGAAWQMRGRPRP